VTLTGVLADYIGISPLPFFSMASNNVLEVSLSPHTSWQEDCHLLPCKYVFVARFLLSSRISVIRGITFKPNHLSRFSRTFMASIFTCSLCG